MASIKLSGLPPYDGEYPLPTDLDLGELYFIEQKVHVRAGEVEEALAAGSIGVLACVVAIALKRAGQGDVPLEAILAAKPDNIDVDTSIDEEAVEERPPASATTNGLSNGSVVAASESEPTATSGTPSSDAGADRPVLPLPTGSHG